MLTVHSAELSQAGTEVGVEATVEVTGDTFLVSSFMQQNVNTDTVVKAPSTDECSCLLSTLPGSSTKQHLAPL